MAPAIIIAAYNRPHSLRRLLLTIQRADFGGQRDIELTISVDRSSSSAVCNLAKAFEWKQGPKTVLEHEHHLGLKAHILFCGDLTDRYGSGILLEDDVVVSPAFYHYACQALAHYRAEERVAGVSLYSYRYNEFAREPFLALDDGYDNYFLSLPVSWGQAWTSGQWKRFREWRKKRGEPEQRGIQMPQKPMSWPHSSWKKEFLEYMLAERTYFVIPRVSLTTNFADRGTHVRDDTTLFQVPLLLSSKRFRFSTLETSTSVYDSFHELESSCMKRLNPSLADYDFECDLYGIKDLANVTADLVLTTRRLPDPIRSYKHDMKPPELNVILDIDGDEIFLAPVGKGEPA